MRTPHVRIVIDPRTFQPLLVLNLDHHKIGAAWPLETMYDAKVTGNKPLEYLVTGMMKAGIIEAVPDITSDELEACFEAIKNFKPAP